MKFSSHLSAQSIKSLREAVSHASTAKLRKELHGSKSSTGRKMAYAELHRRKK